MIEVTQKVEVDFSEWLALGMSMGWCGPVVCETHDGLPLSAEEESELFEEGNDPCISIIRVYYDDLHRHEVEENHSPSIWRK